MKKFLAFLIATLLCSVYSYGQRTYDLSYSIEVQDAGGNHVDTLTIGKSYYWSITVSNKSTVDFKGDLSLQVGIDPKHTEPPFTSGDVTFTIDETGVTIAHLSNATFRKGFKATGDLFKKVNAPVIVITWPTDDITNSDKDTTNDHALIKIYVADPNSQVSGISQQGQQLIGLYPNPASETAILSVGDISGTATITLSDITGRVVMSQQLNVQAGQSIALPLAQIPAGLYILNVISGSKTQTAKLQVVR